MQRVRGAQQAFYDAWRPQERARWSPRTGGDPAPPRAASSALVIAGGHVGELAQVLHLFHVAPHLPPRVVAWSAGAMALTERVVLFHDCVPHGAGPDRGVRRRASAWCRGVVLLPHARRRLRVDDRIRMSVLARRFAPARCLVLDDGTRRGARPRTGGLPPDARVVGARRPHRRGSRRHDLVRASSASWRSTGSGTASRWTPRRSTGSWRAHEVPIVEGRAVHVPVPRRGRRGAASCSAIVGLPEQLPMRRLRGTDLWYLVLELPEGSRVNYQLEVTPRRARRADQRPAQPQALLQPGGHVVGVLRARLRRPRSGR